MVYLSRGNRMTSLSCELLGQRCDRCPDQSRAIWLGVGPSCQKRECMIKAVQKPRRIQLVRLGQKAIDYRLLISRNKNFNALARLSK
jgi:hypothetical protein